MVNIIVELSKYVIILLITMYTYFCFSIFGYQDSDKKLYLLRRQNVLMFMMHIVAFLVMYLETEDIKLLAFYAMQVVLFGATILIYTMVYPKISRLVVNNMCMLMAIGFLILSRLSFDRAVKQFTIAVGSMIFALGIPFFIQKIKFVRNLSWIYAAAGLLSLGAVAALGATSYGAKISFRIAGITLQPSEFVKIIFVFFS